MYKIMTYYPKTTHAVPNNIIEQVIKLCQEKIQDQKDLEKAASYGLDDYSEGRIVGSAVLSRKILSILGVDKSFY